MRNLLLATALLAGMFAVVVVRDRPPDPRPADAPPGEFSAVRAQAYLRGIVADGAPRPAGSEAGALAVERISAQLRALGYAPAIQDAFDCGLYGMCARVRNVVARLEGTAGGRAVLLVAHHDSVSAGPGAADDASGVAAILEIARALRSGPPTDRPVIFLLDDAEEGGLIGASAFARQHPWAPQVGAVVNLEARGTSGASLMFETSGANDGIAAALRALPRPRTSSLFAAVYALLPNDTDLTVFKRLGVPGMNFAFIGNAQLYHTARDDLAHLSAASLQHQGENALAAVGALARSDLERSAGWDAVFFDVLGLAVVAWPVWAALPLAALALLATLCALARLRRRDGLTHRAVAWGLAAFAATGLVAAILGVALRVAAVGPGLEAGLFAAQPPAFVAATWLAGLGGATATALTASRRATPAGLWAGTALGWALLAVAVSALLPGASHLFAVPALVAGLAGLTWALSSSRREAWSLAAILAPAAAAALLLFPVAWMLPDAAGSHAAPLSAALIGLVAAALAPLLARQPVRPRRLVAAVAGAAFLTTGAAAIAVLRGSTEQRMSIYFHEEGHAARWLVDTEARSLPEPMRQLAPFSAQRTVLLPWAAYRRGFSATAAPLGLPPPTLEVLERRTLADGKRVVRARIASPRGAPAVVLALPAAARVESVVIGGTKVAPPPGAFRRFFQGWQTYGCLTVPREGVEAQIESATGEPVEAVLLDRSSGLPPAGAALQEARPQDATPDGDVTVVSARVKL